MTQPAPPPSQPPVVVFVCSAPADAGLRDELAEHLAPLSVRGALELWHDGMLSPGSNVERVKLEQLDRARIVLAMTTTGLLNSPECQELLTRARQHQLTIVPVIAKPCLWEETALGSLEPLPSNRRPVSAAIDRDAVWLEVATAVGVLARGLATAELRAQPTAEDATPRARWLRAVVGSAARRRMLGGVGAGLGVDLAVVRVSVRLAADATGAQPFPPLAEQLVDAQPGTRLVLVGDVGTGKSELLYETAARLAERALTIETAPVPIIVRARDLAKGLKEALLVMWPACHEILPALLESRARFILLVDSLDEADREAPEHIEAQVAEMGDRCHALVVASRAILRFRELRAQERRLVRWSPNESDCFLARCAEHLPRAADRLWVARASVAPELLENPLTASMCLLVAEREPEALHSRVALFHAVVRRLVGDWLAQRQIAHARVGKVMSALETLALDVVQRSLEAISESHVLSALGRNLPYQEFAGVETAEAHLGLLVRRADGAFDFALRSLAEHLAGRALLLAGEVEIVAASTTAWGAEPVRHAIGLAAVEGPHSSAPTKGHASRLIDALLRGEEEDDITSTNRHLRSVLAAVCAASDLDRIRRSTLKCLMAAVVRRLWDETSTWVGERVADVVASWVRARPGHVRDLVIVALQAILQPASRASWFAAQTCEDPNVWVEWFRERDSSVRSLVTEDLAPCVDEPMVRRVLLAVMHDDGMNPGSQPVAMGAGSILRRATRDTDFQELLPDLCDILERGDAFQQAGAAIALLPGEADPVKRAIGLCRALGGSGFGVPRAVLEEVAADPAGRTELERMFPDWATKSEPQQIEALPPDWEGNPPCSAEVRQRLVRAIAPALRAASSDLLKKVTSINSITLAGVACELADDAPELICALLDAAPESPLTLYSEHDIEKLSRAAVRHAPVRKSLLDYWCRIHEAPPTERNAQWKADYPGRALDGLVRTNDVEAQRAFAEWVVVGHHSIPFRPFDAVLLDGFDCPPLVRDAGHSVAVTYFEAVGKVVLSTLAGGLFRLSSFWKHDIEMRRGVEAWLAAGAMGEFRCGLWALQRVGLTEEARRDLAKHVIALFGASEQPFFRHDLWQLLPQIDAMGLLGDLRELVEALAKDESLAMIAVPLTMPWHDAREQRARSKRVCKSFSLLDSVPPYLAVRLVEAAPDVWAAMLEAASVGASSIEPVLPFLRGLPAPLQARVGRRWLESASEFPWVRDGMSPFCIRPADKVREILFDLGIEEPPPPEIR